MYTVHPILGDTYTYRLQNKTKILCRVKHPRICMYMYVNESNKITTFSRITISPLYTKIDIYKMLHSVFLNCVFVCV